MFITGLGTIERNVRGHEECSCSLIRGEELGNVLTEYGNLTALSHSSAHVVGESQSSFPLP